jgi:hypothetical protein
MPLCARQVKVVAELDRRGLAASRREAENRLAEATAWLPHTTRAALTGLRKRGATLTSDKADGVTRYRLPVAR